MVIEVIKEDLMRKKASEFLICDHNDSTIL